MSGIVVKLEVFEGPLDLLLHLIDKNKVSIYDIPIVTITEQYMDYIKEMQEKNLDIISEFLVMAAMLLNIKSKLLLPKEEVKIEEKEDPRQELIDRLLEYKMFKYISKELKGKQEDANKIVFKETTIPKEIVKYKEEIRPEDLVLGLTLDKLHSIFESIIKKQKDKIDPIRSKFGEIEQEEIGLVEKLLSIEQYLKINNKISFKHLLNVQPLKMEIIVTFLAILELMKIGIIEIVQIDRFDDILISYNVNARVNRNEVVLQL